MSVYLVEILHRLFFVTENLYDLLTVNHFFNVAFHLADGFLLHNRDIQTRCDDSLCWVLGGAGDGDCAEKIRLALSANENLCDFCVLNYTQIPEFARAGALVDISESMKPYEATMTAAAARLSRYGEEVVGVPFEVKTKVWFYRSDIFDECGIDVKDIVDTDAFIAAGKKVQERYPNSYMWNLGSQIAGYSVYLTLSGNGASFSDENGEYNIASDAGTRLMLEDYKKMVDAGVIANISD